MTAREEILAAIRARQVRDAERPPQLRIAPPAEDLAAHFVQRARAAAAQVHVLASAERIPGAIADILRSRNLPAIVHLPPDPLLEQIPWNEVRGLSIRTDLPGPDDVAISFVPLAIAETGTLAYLASPARPPSWHFRPGVEIALLGADNIHSRFEDICTRLAERGALPSTVNLVTGPSRTGDIEQTLELGAHGPKELVILIVPSFGSGDV